MSTQASIIAVCDAIVSYLNGLQHPTNPFAPFTFVAYRDYAPIFQLTKLNDLKVVVCPRNKNLVIAGRPSLYQDDGVDIGILVKPASLNVDSPATTLDPLMLLVEQISDSLAFEEIGGSAWIETQNVPVFAADHLREYKQFSSVLSLKWRRVRRIS